MWKKGSQALNLTINSSVRDFRGRNFLRRVVMKCSFRPILLLPATLSAIPLGAQSTRADERAAAAANSTTHMPVVIPAGTPLTVAIDQDLSSASVNQGEPVAFHLTSDYSEFGHVLIKGGQRGGGAEPHAAARR